MDKVTLKMVLGACRPGQGDAGDPLIAEALREAGRDPELAAWLEEERRFDAFVADHLGSLPTPAGLKESILLNARASQQRPTAMDRPPAAWRHPAATWLAVAAGLALAFLLGRHTLPDAVQSSSGADADRLALQAISYTGRMPALQFVCFDPAEVARWVNGKSASLHMGQLIDKPMAKMQMIGSSTTQWDGKPVVMIALQKGDQMAMLYLLRAADFPDEAAAAGGIMEKDGWVSKTGREGDHLYVLTTKGTRKDLDFPMPL